MAGKEFVAVSFQDGQLLDEDTLTQMNSNDVANRQQGIDGKYMHLNNGVTDIGLKMLCGRRQITPRKNDTVVIRIGFARMFTPNTNPVVTTSITSHGMVKVFHIINGIGRLHPNHQGFEAKVQIAANSKKNDRFRKSMFVNWIAMGY